MVTGDGERNKKERKMTKGSKAITQNCLDSAPLARPFTRSKVVCIYKCFKPKYCIYLFIEIIHYFVLPIFSANSKQKAF